VAVTDLPILGMLRTRMQWHQARQKVIAENVANADLPGFKPRDLVAPRFDRATGAVSGQGGVGMAATEAGHIVPAGAEAPVGETRRAKGFEVRPSGNGVNLEEEMMKAGDNQADYQLAASLYQKSLDALKIAVGKR